MQPDVSKKRPLMLLSCMLVDLDAWARTLTQGTGLKRNNIERTRR